MKNDIEITGVIAEVTDIEKIKMLLEAAGITEIKIRTLPQYDDWLGNLPTENIPGLSNACLEWIHDWGNGGGDSSSEDCITDAVKVLKSNVPVKLADAVYNSIADYSKSKFDAAGLTIEMITGCMENLKQADDKE